MTGTLSWSRWRQELLGRLGRDPVAAPEVRRKAALVLVDDVGCGLAATLHPEVSALAEGARASAGSEATLLAGGRASRERAAVANAVALGWDELDGGYRPAPCHGGLYAIPSSVAEAEATGASVDDLLGALVIGYEAAAAVAEAFPPSPGLELHPHATLAPVGAAAAVTWLRTRRAEDVLGAVDAAVTLGARGPFEHATRGLLVRNVWAAAGAQHGFLAADAVAAGIGSDADAMLDVLSRSTPFVGRLPETDWAVLAAYHKPYAACQYAHSGIEAAAELARLVRPTEIREVLIETHPLAMALDGLAPSTVLAGKFSLPHTVAAVLVAGRTDPDVFGRGLLRDRTVGALRAATRMVPLDPLPPAPHDRATRVTVGLSEGREVSATCSSAWGSPDRPLGVDDVLEKLTTSTVDLFPRFGRGVERLVAGDGGEGSVSTWLRSMLA